jgi:hypothetical protein
MTPEQSALYGNYLVASELAIYCQKTREEMKDKLKHFGTLPSEFIKYMTTYNLLRNCYEHHKAISHRGLQIPIKEMGLFTHDGKKIVIGEVLEGPTTINLKFTQKTIHIKKGQPALLTYEDLVSTELYLMLEVSKQLENNVNDIIQHTRDQNSRNDKADA